MRMLRRLIATVTVVALLGTATTATAAQDQSTELPSELTGKLRCSTYFQSGAKTDTILGTVEGGDLVRHETRGFLGRFDIDAISDSRLEGIAYQVMDSDEYIGPQTWMPDHVRVDSSLFRIDTAEGTWQGSDAGLYLPATWHQEPESTWQRLVLTGEGAFDGSTALIETRLDDRECRCWSFGYHILDRCTWDVRGVILDGELPGTPIPRWVPSAGGHTPAGAVLERGVGVEGIAPRP